MVSTGKVRRYPECVRYKPDHGYCKETTKQANDDTDYMASPAIFLATSNLCGDYNK